MDYHDRSRSRSPTSGEPVSPGLVDQVQDQIFDDDMANALTDEDIALSEGDPVSERSIDKDMEKAVNQTGNPPIDSHCDMSWIHEKSDEEPGCDTVSNDDQPEPEAEDENGESELQDEGDHDDNVTVDSEPNEFEEWLMKRLCSIESLQQVQQEQQQQILETLQQLVTASVGAAPTVAQP
eukprot:6491481-Amphidinium_carterae.1